MGYPKMNLPPFLQRDENKGPSAWVVKREEKVRQLIKLVRDNPLISSEEIAARDPELDRYIGYAKDRKYIRVSYPTGRTSKSPCWSA